MTASLMEDRRSNALLLGFLALAALIPFSFMPKARVDLGPASIPVHFLIFVPAGAAMLALAGKRAIHEHRVPVFVWLSLAVVASMTASSFSFQAPEREGLSTVAGMLFRCVALGWFSYALAGEQNARALATGSAVLGAVVAACALYEPATGRYFLFTRAITLDQPSGELFEPSRRIAVGAIGQPLPLAVLLNLFLPFALSEWQSRRRWIWAVPVVLILLGIFMTFRRSGYVIALLTCGAFVFRSAESRRNIAVALGAAAACMAVVLLFPAPRRILAERFNPSTTLHELRYSHRTRVYGTVASMAAQYPVFGIGTRQYERRYKDFTAYDNAWATPDNQYLRFLAEGGWIGLVTFLAFLGYTLRRLWQGRADGAPYFLAAAGFAAFLFLLDGLYWPATGMAFFVIAGAGVGRIENHEER